MRRQGRNSVGHLFGGNGPQQVVGDKSFKLDSYQEIQHGEPLGKMDIDLVKESDLCEGKSINDRVSLLQEHQSNSAHQDHKYTGKLYCATGMHKVKSAPSKNINNDTYIPDSSNTTDNNTIDVNMRAPHNSGIYDNEH